MVATLAIQPLVVEHIVAPLAGNPPGFGRTSRPPRREDLTLSSYLRDIAPFPLLSAEEERALAERIAQGDTEAKQRLIESNLRLVLRIAKRYLTHGVDLMDLIQAGNMGLMRAAQTYDVTQGYRFSTHAVPWIRQSVSRLLMNTDRAIRVPVHLHSQIGTLVRTSSQLAEEQQGTEPTVTQVAQALELPTAQVARLRQLAQPLLSLDRPISAHSSSTLAESLPDEEMPPLEDWCARRDEHTRFCALLPDLLATLSRRERHLLVLRFGLLGGKTHTLAQIGHAFGLSRERVRQIEQRALLRLREALDSVSLQAGKPV